MAPKVVIASGGTGGHLLPATAVARDLKPHAELYFIGSGLQKSPCFDQKSFPFTEITAGGLNFSFPWKLSRGVIESWALLRKISPDCVIGFGSYHSLPVLVAALIMRKKVILHEQNMIPGRVIRMLAPFACWTGVNFQGCRIPGKKRHVKAPMHELSVEDPYAYFGLSPKKPIVLITGGSQGAKSIDDVVPKALDSNVQVIHCASKASCLETLRQQYRQASITAYVTSFEEKMHLAWQVATVAVARSGAGSLFEQIAYTVPGVLIPYPFAASDHQTKNAEFMEKNVRGAYLLPQKELSATKLKEMLTTLMQKRKEKKEAIEEWKQKNCAPSFSKEILEFIK